MSAYSSRLFLWTTYLVILHGQIPILLALLVRDLHEEPAVHKSSALEDLIVLLHTRRLIHLVKVGVIGAPLIDREQLLCDELCDMPEN